MKPAWSLQTSWRRRRITVIDDLGGWPDVFRKGGYTNFHDTTGCGPPLWRSLRHSRVFCTRFTGPYENDFADTAEYEGGLLTLLRESQAFVKRHTTESWEKTPDSRIERRSYSTRAVEEVLVNALIHRSYLVLGSEVHIDMYDDRMEIYSPGAKIGDPLPEDVMATRVKSERRNPIIADVFS